MEKNHSKVGLSENALKLLKASKDLYNDYSHVSLWSIRLSVISDHKSAFGGGYDEEQRPLFEKELQIREQFIEKVPSFLGSLYKRLA